MATTGFVVRGTGNLFLSRTHRYVLQKSDKLTWVVSCAWVHGTKELLAGGDWSYFAVTIYPARYSATRDTTEVIGDPMTYAEFLEAHKPPSVESAAPQT